MAKTNKNVKLGGTDPVAAPEATAEELAEKEVVVEKNDSPERRALLAKLDYYNVTVTGSETDAELANMLDAAEVDQKAVINEQEEINGVPNQLSPRSEMMTFNGKSVRVPLTYVAQTKGGSVLYNENGKRISPAYGPTDHVDPNDDSSPLGTKHIAKLAAIFNVRLRQIAEQESRALRQQK